MIGTLILLWNFISLPGSTLLLISIAGMCVLILKETSHG